MRARLLPLVLCAAAASVAHAQQPRRSEPCSAIEDCIGKGAICWIVEVPRQDRKVLQSEAFEDMESRIATLQGRHADTHFVVVPDAARYLHGLAARSRVRTVFVGLHGRALVYEGLFVDDVAPVAAYLRSGELAPQLRGHVREAQLGLSPPACRAKGPK